VNAPQRVIALFLLALTGSLTLGGPVSRAAAGRDPSFDVINSEIDRLLQAKEFSGVALVARGGQSVFARAGGLANRSRLRPNRLETRFNLGSMNKMFTAVAVAQLAQRGKLQFTDAVAGHLADYPNRDVANRVTIHQLLTHTSGLGDIFGAEFEAGQEPLRQAGDYIQILAPRPLAFSPGARWSYSSFGFIVLGAIIEKASGQSYDDYVYYQIFQPAGMTRTGFHDKDDAGSDLALGYTYTGGTNHRQLPPRGTPAGGGYSTAEDLARFADALLTYRLLNREYADLVLSRKVVTPRGGKYCYGFAEWSHGGRRVVGHGGGFPGISSQLDIHLESGYTVVVLSNTDPPAAARLARFIAGKLTPADSPRK